MCKCTECKAALNAKDAHTKYWISLVNRSYLIKKMYLWHYFWQHPYFTALLHKCLKLLTVGYCSSAGRFLEASWRRCHSSSVFRLSQFVRFLPVVPDRLDDDKIRSLCGALAVVRQKSLDYYKMAKWIIGDVNWYFLLTHISKI